HPSNLNYEAFLNGNYSRKTAVDFFLNKGLSLFGEGPGRYYIPGTTKHIIGVHGHVLTFYAEIGLVGLISSYIFLCSIIPFNFSNFVLFVALTFLSLSTNIASDTNILFVFCMFGKILDNLENYESNTMAKKLYGFHA
ncbi:MAG: hypothetical protein ACOCUH_03510, partial [Bacteriovoracia bacterium]